MPLSVWWPACRSVCGGLHAAECVVAYRQLPGITQDNLFRSYTYWTLIELWAPAEHNGIAPERGHVEWCKEQAYDHYTLAKHKADCFPASAPELGKLVSKATVALAREVASVEAVSGSRRTERFWVLIKFLQMAVGTHKQRLLLLLSTLMGSMVSVIRAIESNFVSSLLIASVSSAVSRQASDPSRAAHLARKAAAAPVFGDVFASIVILKLVTSLLRDLQSKVSSVGSGSIRKYLSRKLTWQVLSTDMADAVKHDSDGFTENKAADMMGYLQDEQVI